jgi:hypothetical protein
LAVLLFFISAFLNFIAYLVNPSSTKFTGPFSSIRLAFVKVFLSISLISYLLVEVLSFNNQLSFTSISIAWGLVAVGIGIFLWKNNSNIHFTIISFKAIEKRYQWLLIFGFIFVLLPLLLLSIFIPPNNWDSLAYHLPRIEHWIQNKNIYPYPTNLIRQIITPPFSEYVLLQLRILSVNDCFLNLLQYFSLIGVLFITTQLFQFLKINYKGQILLCAVLISLPMLIFQSTTTQTDLLSAFYLLAFILFSYLFVQDNNKASFIYLVIALSIGILTKYTIAIFALPFILYIIYHVLKQKNLSLLLFATTSSVIIAAIVLGPFLYRNYLAFGSLTGNEYFGASMSNSKISFAYTISNSIKNIADFISVQMNAFNHLMLSFIDSIHLLIGISVNDKGANWNEMNFIVNNHLNEDSAGSLLHFIIFIVSLVLLFRWKDKKWVVLYIAGLLLTFFIYSSIFRYSPWNNRLFLPLTLLFMLASSYIFIKSIKNESFLFSIAVFLFIISLFPVYMNRAKPIIIDPFYLKRVLSHSPKAAEGSKTIFQKTREENYFVWTPFLQKQLDTVFENIPPTANKINLSTEFDSHEYMIWLYAQKHFNHPFYIGTAQGFKYKPFTQNNPSASFYNLSLVDSSMHWKSIVYNK